MRGIIIKDDKRYWHTENFLEGKGHMFFTVNEVAEGLDFVIFPFAEAVDEKTYGHNFFSTLKKDVLIFSGIRSKYLTYMCEKFNLQYHVLLENEVVAAKNAVPTSEGVIAYLITNLHITIAKSRVLIVGYGICGRDLARRLKGLEAHVCALVRNEEKARVAKTAGVEAVFLHQFDESEWDIIINTVEGAVLPQESLENRYGTLFIDIASKPHGFDMKQVRRLNPASALLSGIPGKYAVKTAGEILGEFIHDILKGGVL